MLPVLLVAVAVLVSFCCHLLLLLLLLLLALPLLLLLLPRQQDIEGIEIRSEAETRGRRSYNYRVVMR